MQLQYISSLLCCKTVPVYDITDAQWRKINQKVPKYFFFVMTSIVYYCTHVMLRHAIPLGALLYQHVSLFNYVGLYSRPSPVFFLAPFAAAHKLNRVPRDSGALLLNVNLAYK